MLWTGSRKPFFRTRIGLKWSHRFVAKGKGFPFIPRLIGISPTVNSELHQVLVDLIVEELHQGGRYADGS